LAALTAELGYTISELFVQAADMEPQPALSKPKRAKAKVAVKYRDPDNRRNTWTGRGSHPRWLREKVRRGVSPADFLIDQLGRPTANTNSIGKRTVFKQG
jgi:DNA-binding protein H-NS